MAYASVRSFAVYFFAIVDLLVPLGWDAPVSMIERYTEAARANDLTIAKIGIWCNPMVSDSAKRAANQNR